MGNSNSIRGGSSHGTNKIVSSLKSNKLSKEELDNISKDARDVIKLLSKGFSAFNKNKSPSQDSSIESHIKYINNTLYIFSTSSIHCRYFSR